MSSGSFSDFLRLPALLCVGLLSLAIPAYVVLELLPAAPTANPSDGSAPTDLEVTTKGPRLVSAAQPQPTVTLALPPQPAQPSVLSLQPVPRNTVMPTGPAVMASTEQPSGRMAVPPPMKIERPDVATGVGTGPTFGPAPSPKASINDWLTYRGMDKRAPIMLRIFKQEAELEVWKRDRSGRFALLKTYPICRWSGLLGPKVRTGDLQSPEGFYTVTPAAMNPNSAYHLSFNLGFPNAYDRAHGRSGSFLMVHGDCKSVGCYAMTNAQITEIYQLATDAFGAGQTGFQVQAYPFRMTAQNFARHRNSPHLAFWQNLKEGHDLFDLTRQPPEVQVCNRSYGFGAGCGSDRVAQNVLVKLSAKRKSDETAIAALVKRGVAAEPPSAAVATRLDGGTHASFSSMFAVR